MGGLANQVSLDDPTIHVALRDSDRSGDASEDSEPGSQAAPSEQDLLSAGAWVGRYQILEVVGTGGIGIVYAARDQDLGRNVALKLLRPHARSTRKLERRRARLVREAQALARLSHPNVVPIYEVGMFEDRVYLAMEYIEGSTMRRWIRRSRPSRDEILAKYREAGRGLAAAHAADIVHRDFKPENVLVGYDGRVRVLDFGLATPVPDALASGRYSTLPLDPSPGRGPTTARNPTLTDSVAALVTAHGKVMGTPAYMAPEQARGDLIDARADQFSFCVALWEALLGGRPELGDLRSTRRQRRISERHRSLGGDVPLYVLRALERGLSPTPHDRFPSMDALLDALAPRPKGARRWVLALGAGLVCAATLGFALAPGRSTAEQCPRDLEALARVWDPPMRDAVRERITASGQAYANATWKTVEHELDRWAERWLDASVDNCEDTRVRDEQASPRFDQRRACLERQRVALAAVTTSLAQASTEHHDLDDQLDQVLRAVLSLPDPESCEDDPKTPVLALLGPPRHDHDRAEHEGQPSPADAERLGRARSALERGELEAGFVLVGELLTDLEALGPGRSSGEALARAEALLLRARLQTAADHAEAGEADLRAAVFAGQSGGHDRVTVAAATALADLARARGELDRATDWLDLARASLTRMGGDFELSQTLALALLEVADLALAEGQLERGRALVLEAQGRAVGDLNPGPGIRARAEAWLAAHPPQAPRK